MILGGIPEEWLFKGARPQKSLSEVSDLSAQAALSGALPHPRARVRAGRLGVISETISVAASSFLHHFLNYGIHVQIHGWKIAGFILFNDPKAIFFIEAYCLSI